MKGKQHPRNDVSLNPSTSRDIHAVVDAVDPARRRFVGGGLGAAALASAGGLTLGGLVDSVEARPLGRAAAADGGPPGISFTSVPPSLAPVADRVTVPAGYTARAFVAWGDPIMPGGPAFAGDARESAAEQALQFGMHNDGMHFFPFPRRDGRENPEHGLLCVNNEYTHEEVLHPDGLVGAGYTLAKTRKSQAAHGVSIVEAARVRGQWRVVRRSPFGRRITANTFMRISGPAAGHALLKTREFTITDAATTPTGGTTDGTVAYGTINNCAHGWTPWGTYLTCEENWNGNFGATGALDTTTATEVGKLNRRYGLSTSGNGYRWHTTDPRFDLSTNPNEPHLFGWVVEIDPFRPDSTPVKRTMLGRFKHESVQHVVDDDHRIAFYMGDDERNEYIYKFVAKRRYNPALRAANRNLLDEGTLYVARFDSDLTGVWIALAPDTVGIDGVKLRDNPNFAGADDAEVQAKILIKTRMAADAVGATMMDRPEWTGARPRIGGFEEIEVYCTLTNNNRRGTSSASANAADGSTAAGSARPPVDAANPREDNVYGHIIRWREAGRSVAATRFAWDLFVQAGDSATTKTAKPSNDYRGNIADDPNGSADYGAPDGLWFDPFGRLWVQTDQAGNAQGDWVHIGANCMVCADPATGATRRFLTAPPNAEVTGVTMTPDGRTMFVGVQHPGEDSSAANPTQYSNWPQSQWSVESDGVTPLPGGRPRSTVVVITKDDGGIIGT
ncbi:PhoX family protein [Rubrivivax benzoatilyticus]|uniref:PhoX family phosphatase n=1 Tax=Rubrivivax benzoatilyticus TaxID=316997 RepID=A0ABX0HYF8_9BURK|nr:PhoX family phosphatase [Rubrivivax benzoatilyticus]EGJ09197.1 twin-arginine translocation pathway signal protein [Rubrivivax benzoatilyticus JA2 = ATCC BAA-35]NHL00044.1 PhoX family phosphatase [Rubrivivax benzoatilyticus]NHL25940.1 PhoX family phosphatase [Rubrivivax benzoatilyticus]